MAFSVYAPRINNNDDEVTLVSIDVAVGDWVTSGKVIAQVETEKATVDVEAPVDGFVLDVLGEVGSKMPVGSILMWLGADPSEPVPQDSNLSQPPTTSSRRSGMPTGKVRLLLREYGLDPAGVPASGDRLTVEDVQRYLAEKNKSTSTVQPRESDVRPSAEILPDIAGEWRDLRPDEKGMLATVAWHHDHAVPGYIELGYDAAPWGRFSAEFAERHKLLLNPLLPLMAWRLTRIAAQQPKLNSTILSGRRFEYSTVNLGFTVQ